MTRSQIDAPIDAHLAPCENGSLQSDTHTAKQNAYRTHASLPNKEESHLSNNEKSSLPNNEKSSLPDNGKSSLQSNGPLLNDDQSSRKSSNSTKMIKKCITKEDGRQLIFYSFEPIGTRSESAAEEKTTSKQEKDSKQKEGQSNV